jgi:hypothetical protein
MIRALAVVLVLGTLLALPATSSADEVTWNLVGVTLQGGGSVTGSFVFDADAVNTDGLLGVVISADIVTPAVTPSNPYATTPSGFQPLTETDSMGGFTEIVFVQKLSDLTGAPLLDLTFRPPLMDAGGKASIDVTLFDGVSTSTELHCADSDCTGPDSTPPLNIVSGGVETPSGPVTTPEPSAFLLLGMGLFSLVGAAKTRVARIQ